MEQVDPVREVFLSFCEGVDTPTSLGAWLRYEYSHADLASMEINPRDYASAYSFHADYSVVSFLSKYKGLKTGIDTAAVALQKFKTSEETCRETNRRLKTELPPPELGSILHAAKAKIARLLGPFSVLKLSACGWGPGATYDLPRSRAFLDTKMCKLPITVSRSCMAQLCHEISSDLEWKEAILHECRDKSSKVLEIVNSCRVTTVPKNAKTDRIIAIEPTGNLFIQKAYGKYIRDKLRTVGVTLDDQQRNQDLARQAQAMELATLDLRAASDTVSKEIVWSLLPFEWACALDATRSRCADLPDGTTIVLEKFSSMGNGFTFELESLIFWALAQSTVDSVRPDGGTVAVYGDDIIVNQNCSSMLVSLLAFCGFEVNEAKSFVDGRFYESCGKHYYDGQDVTPAYQKEVPSCEMSIIRMGNRLLRLAKRLGSFGFDCRLKGAWRKARRLDANDRFRIPFCDQGDDGWAMPRSFFGEHRFDVHRGYLCKVGRISPLSYPANDRALLAWTLRRGTATIAPFLGELQRPGDSITVSRRWVHPTREFGLDFE